MEVSEAYRLVARAIDAGRAAHGYLVVGDLKGSCAELTDLILGKLFPDAQELVARRGHPDVVYLTPQGKSRKIKVARGKDDEGPGMRDGLIAPLAETSFAGGWKVGVVIGADRMVEEAANAFLKSLEEPTPKTLYLLLTEAPESILPTVVSRTQRIDLPFSDGMLSDESLAAVTEVMASKGISDAFSRAQAGRRLAAILGELKAAAADEDAALVRKRFYRTLASFARRWMVEERLPRFLAFRNIEAVEDAYRQSECYMPDETVLCFLTDRLAFPE